MKAQSHSEHALKRSIPETVREVQTTTTCRDVYFGDVLRLRSVRQQSRFFLKQFVQVTGLGAIGQKFEGAVGFDILRGA